MPQQPVSKHHEDCYQCNGTGEYPLCLTGGMCDPYGCIVSCHCDERERGWTEDEVWSEQAF